MELRLEVELCEQWAAGLLLRVMALQLLVEAGRFPVNRTLRAGDLLPLGVPPDAERRSSVTCLLVSPPSESLCNLQLPSGSFDLLLLFGISESEAEFSRRAGVERLVEKLRASTHYPVTQLYRTPIA